MFIHSLEVQELMLYSYFLTLKKGLRAKQVSSGEIFKFFKVCLMFWFIFFKQLCDLSNKEIRRKEQKQREEQS